MFAASTQGCPVNVPLLWSPVSLIILSCQSVCLLACLPDCLPACLPASQPACLTACLPLHPLLLVHSVTCSVNRFFVPPFTSSFSCLFPVLQPSSLPLSTRTPLSLLLLSPHHSTAHALPPSYPPFLVPCFTPLPLPAHYSSFPLQLVRVGGRSKSERLIPYNMQEVKRRAGRMDTTRSEWVNMVQKAS